MEPIRIVIADDHAVVREGLRRMLSSQADMEVVGEAEDGAEAIEQIRKLNPQVLLLDISMPNINGLEAISVISKMAPEVKIVILSMYDSENYIQQVLNAGALGYVLKASDASEIYEAIRVANRGEYYLGSEINRKVIGTYLVSSTATPEVNRYKRLSDREKEVFLLLVEGKSIKEIAAALFVSPKTIEKHRTSISSKMGIQSRTGLIRYAIKSGIVDPDLWDD